MANAATLGALRIILGADTSSLDSGLRDARAGLSTFASDLAKTGAVIAGAITAGYGVVALGVSNTIRSMDEIGKQSQKIGVPVEQLSALKLAADVSGVSMEQLGTGVGKLSKAMVEAASKPLSDSANAFKALGVSVTDSTGKLRPTQDVIISIADKFEGLKNGAGKTAVSMALFGKSGAELIPFLNQGGTGISEMTAAAKKFGIMIDGDTAKAAEKFRDTLTLLGAAKDGLITKLTAYLLPSLQVFAQRMLDGASNVDKQNQKLSILKTGFDLFARAVLVVADNFKIVLQLGAVFVGAQIASAAVGMGLAFVSLARAVQSTGLVLAAFEAVRALSTKGLFLIAGIIAIATGSFDSLKDKLSELATYIGSKIPDGSSVLGKALKGLGLNLSALTEDLKRLNVENKGGKKTQDDFNFSLLAGKTAINQYLDAQQKRIASQEAEAATIGKSVGEHAKLRIALEAEAIRVANNIFLTDQMAAKIAATGQAAAMAAMKIAGANATMLAMSPAQQLEQSMGQLKQLYDAGTISLETYEARQKQLAENAQATWNIAGASMAGGFSQLAGAFSKSSSQMATTAKVFGSIEATINTYTAFTKALASAPPPINYVLAAGTLAAGMAKVAAINSMPTGMMTGGALMVRGGGGTDSVPVALNVSPGEQIDVWRPDQGGGKDPRRGTGGVTNVTVNWSGGVVGREGIRNLFEEMNAAFADGYIRKLGPA